MYYYFYTFRRSSRSILFSTDQTGNLSFQSPFPSSSSEITHGSFPRDTLKEVCDSDPSSLTSRRSWSGRLGESISTPLPSGVLSHRRFVLQQVVHLSVCRTVLSLEVGGFCRCFLGFSPDLHSHLSTVVPDLSKERWRDTGSLVSVLVSSPWD